MRPRSFTHGPKSTAKTSTVCACIPMKLVCGQCTDRDAAEALTTARHAIAEQGLAATLTALLKLTPPAKREPKPPPRP